MYYSQYMAMKISDQLQGIGRAYLAQVLQLYRALKEHIVVVVVIVYPKFY